MGEGHHSIREIGGIVNQLSGDEDFDAGFYNQLGGRATSDFVHNLIFFSGTDDGLDGDELGSLMAPFAAALGGATRSGQLSRDFNDGFFRGDLKVSDRDQLQIPAFLMRRPRRATRARSWHGRAGRC